MDLKSYLKKTFGKDLFSHLDKDEIAEERIRAEKKVERISDEMKGIQDRIQQLMIDSKGQPAPMKMLNVQKIKALRLESNTKQQEAAQHIKELQVLLLVEAMREHHESKDKNAFIEKLLNSDIDHLTDTLFDEDVKKAIEEGKMDEVKGRLKASFGKEEIPVDEETQELLKAIEELEDVDDETALRMAGEKAKAISETAPKKVVRESE